MEYKDLIYEVEGRVAYLTLNRPKQLNSLSNNLKRELEDAVSRIEQDNHIWGVILTGAGKAFCSGTDISEFPDNAEGTRRIVVWTHEIFNRIENLEKPVIAVMNGYALGGGLELTLACDIRIAEEGAKMGLVEAKIGAMPCYGGTQRMTRLIGAGRTKELIFTAQMVKADEALEMGIINHVVPAGEGMAKAKNIMDMILKNAPLSVAYSKIAVNRGAEMSLDYGLHMEQQLVSMLVVTEDLKEGSHAFLEKRIPVYKKH